MNIEALDIFEAVVELPPADRSGELDRRCADDPELRRDVEALLAADADTGGFLDPSASAWSADLADTGAAPVSIGPYTIVRSIGEGGFGSVYLAEQTEPIQRRVAIKVIKPGMDSKAVLRRFDLERQTLASLDHPGIARVLDSGLIPDGEPGAGRPFFAMEYVEGDSVTAFAASADLDVETRVELILQVCAAVQHAHSKGIIHRDIKPSNVLVTMVDERPIAKIIDFGIAKALGDVAPDVTVMTSPGAMVGTPQYMSPEQARGSADIDTRSDVYSVGAVLYELLAGVPPYDMLGLGGRDIDRIRHAINEIDPPAPSSRISSVAEAPDTTTRSTRTHAKRIRGELDWITMRAMSKEPDRRYPTVAALGDDLRRFLASQPVEAGPPSALYRFSKLVRRNQLAFLGGSIAAAGLLVGSIVSIWFGVAANQARDAAEIARRDADEQAAIALRNADRVTAINTFLTNDLFYAVNPSVLGAEATIPELLDAVEPHVETRFADDPAMEAEIRTLLAVMYHLTTQLEPAREQSERSIELLESLAEPPPSLAAEAYETRGTVYQLLGLLDSSEADLRKAYRLGMDYPDEVARLDHLKHALALGRVLDAKGNTADAIALIDPAIDKLWEIPEAHRYVLTQALSTQLQIRAGEGRWDEVGVAAQRLIEIGEQIGGRAGLTASVNGRFWLAQYHRRVDKPLEAAENLLELTDLTLELFGDRSHNYASIMIQAARALTEVGRYEEARPMLDRSIDVWKTVLGNYSYEVERYSNFAARTARLAGDEETFLRFRTRGLLLRLYVAGPGEPDSVIGTIAAAEEDLGSIETWAELVRRETKAVPPGHKMRTRYLAHAALVLRELDEDADVEPLLLAAADALPDAARPEEARHILLHVIPSYYEELGDEISAARWRGQLSDSPG